MESTNQTDVKIVVFAQKILKVCFLMPIDSLSRKANIAFAIVCHLWTFMHASPTALLSIYEVINGFEDINATIESLIGGLNYLSFVYICVCFITQLDELKKIFYGIRVFNEFCNIRVILKAEEKVQFYAKSTYFSIGVFVNVLLPIMDMTGCYERRRSEFYRKYDPCGTVFRCLYPFDTRSTFRKFSIIFSRATAAYFVSLGFLGVTMVLTGLFIHVIAQIRNLKRNIEEVFNKIHDQKDEIKENLRFCIRYHITIIRYTERVFRVFSLIILVHISITSIILGLLLTFILKMDGYEDKLRYGVHLAGWLAALFITCYYAQRVTDESSSIAEAAYASLWYEAPVSLQKEVCLMIVRAQRPLTLKAASSSVVSLVTFLAIVKGAYSFCTVMITVSD